MQSERMTFPQIAAELGIGIAYLHKWWRKIESFPKPRETGKGRPLTFSRAEIMAWIAENDWRKVVSDIRYGDAYRPTAFSRNVSGFLSGGCLTAEQRQQREFRKMVARQTGVKTRRVQLTFPWMVD